MGKPTVLHGAFSTWLPWHQPFLYDLVSGLAEEFRPVVLCNRSENLERFGVPDLVRLKTRALLQPSAAVVVASDLDERFAPRLLHGHFGWSGLRLLLLAPLLRAPLVVTFGGRDGGAQLHDPRMAPLYEVLLAMADQVVCVSHHLRNALAEAGVAQERLSVIHRGTDLAAFPFCDRSAREAPSVALLMIGRLVAKKGHAVALDALARVVGAGHDATLTILGEGPEAGALAEQAERLGVAARVRFAAPTDRAGVRVALEAADVFVHPSITPPDGDVEGIPNVVVEASASGLPVVGTRHGGIGEPVEDGVNGWLVAENDAAALAEAIERVVVGRGARLALGAAGADRMRRGFDARAARAGYAELYARLIAAGADRTRQTAALPEDFVERARRALGLRKMGWEWPVARAVSAAVAGDEAFSPLGDPPRGILDRGFDARTAGPRWLRSGSELALDLLRRTPLRGGIAGLAARSHDRASRLDALLLDRLRAEGLPLGGGAALAPALVDLAGEPANAASSWRRRLRTRLTAE